MLTIELTALTRRPSNFILPMGLCSNLFSLRFNLNHFPATATKFTS